ncbi:Protein patched-like protein 3, partial [Diplonema papillatum]
MAKSVFEVAAFVCSLALVAADCANDDEAARSINESIPSCQEFCDANGGSCSSHGPAFANLSTSQQEAFRQACPWACALCAPLQRCRDQDDLLPPKTGGYLDACSKVPLHNGGNCSLSGPLLGVNMPFAGIPPLIIDEIVFSCPGACGRCKLEDEPCANDEAGAVSVRSDIESCIDVMVANGWHCSVYGAVLSQWSAAEQSAFIAACPFTCRTCARSTACKDWEEDIIRFVGGKYTSCSSLIEANGGCSRTGTVMQQERIGGASEADIDGLLHSCPFSCGKCWPRETTSCVDDDAAFAGTASQTCEDAVAGNGGSCVYGDSSKNVAANATANVSLIDFQEAMTTSCLRTCSFCVDTPAPTMVLPSELFVMEPPSLQTTGAGGVYVLLPANNTCNGVRVWVRTESVGSTVPFYISSDTDGHWTISSDSALESQIQDTTTTACTGYRAYLRSQTPHDVADPSAVVGWEKNGVVSADYRVQLTGCSSDAQCLQLNCQEAEDGYSCEDCDIEAATLTCGSGDSKKRSILIIVVVVVLLLLLGCSIAYYYNDTDAVSPRKSRRFSLPAGGSEKSVNVMVALQQRYRRAFLEHMGALGGCIGTHYPVFFVAIVVVHVAIIATGLQLVDTTSQSNAWVPVGSRAEKELEFVDAWTEDRKQSHFANIMIGPDDDSENALSKHYIIELLHVLQEVAKVKVPLKHADGSFAMNVGWADFCTSIDHPQLDTLMPGAKPCINPSILDCFYEGGWQIDDVSLGRPLAPENQSLTYKNLEKAYDVVRQVAPGAMTTYTGRPSLFDLSEEEVVDRVSQNVDQCDHWIVSTSMARSEMLGSVVDDGVVHPELGNATRLVSAKRLLALSLQYSPKRTKEFRTQLMSFEESDIEDALFDWFEAVEERLESMDNDEVNHPGTRVSVYLSVSMDKMLSEISQGKIESIIIGWFLMVVYVIFTQVSFKNKAENHALVGVAGMLLVLLANLSGFAFTALVGIPWNSVILQTLPFLALGLGVDDMFLLLHYYRGVPDKERPAPAIIADLLRMGGVSVSLTSLCNACAFFSGMVIPIPALRQFLAAAAFIVIFNYTTMILAFPALLAWEARRDAKIIASRSADFEDKPLVPCSIHKFASEVYAGQMQKTSVKIGITAVSFLFVAVMIILLATSHPLDFTMKFTDLTPRGSFLSQGFSDLEEHFQDQRLRHDMVFAEADLPNQQVHITELMNALGKTKWASPDVEKARTWLYWMREYTREQEVNLVDNATQIEYVNASDFYRYFHAWRDPVTGGLQAISAQMTDDFGYRWGIDTFAKENTVHLSSVPYTLNMKMLQTPSDWIDHTEEYHSIAESFIGEGKAFPEPSGKYLQMEEFASLKEHFWTAFFLAAAVIFVCALVIPVSFRGAAIIAVTAMMATIEVAGLLMVFDIGFSSFVAVALLIGMGVSVEFSAHVVAGFETTPGDRDQRTKHAIAHTFIPVAEGGISSFLSFMLLAWSPFPFVFKYFFVVFLIVILVGLLHGLVFLPALIGLVGSTGESDEPVLRPRNGSVDSFGKRINVEPPESISVVPQAVKNPLEARSDHSLDQKEV